MTLERALVTGNPLEGKVIADVTRSIPPTKISLRFYGKEKTCTYHAYGKGGKYDRSSRDLVSAFLVLREMGGGTIEPGTYAFPFRIHLPDSLPSSMKGSDERNRGWWKIQYKLCVLTNNSTTRFAERLVSIASKPLPNEQVPFMVQPAFHRVESFGFGKGSLAVGAKVTDAHVGRDTDLNLSLATRNEASVDIERVQVKLEETVTWYASSRRESTSRILVQHLDVDLPGILRGRQSQAELQQQQRMNAYPDQLTGIFQDLTSGRNCLSIHVPMACRDSYHGSLVRIEHFLKITLKTKSMVSNPKVRIPLKIGYPPTTISPSSQSPSHPAQRRQSPQERPPPIAVVTSEPRPPPTRDPPVPSSEPPIYHQQSVPVLIDTTDLPVAQAVLISTNDAYQAPLASAPLEVIVLGGTVTHSGEIDVQVDNDGSEHQPFAHEYDDVDIPVAPAFAFAETPSVSSLLEEMTYSVYDYDIISSKLQDPGWANLLGSISTEQYGSILAHVNMDIDQPRVAVMLAEHMGPRFVCSFCISAANNASDSSRTVMVERLLPLCADVMENYSSVREVLNEWEQTVADAYYARLVQERG